MAINYGTKHLLQPLNYEEIGVIKRKPAKAEEKSSSWTDFVFSSTFLKGMIIILELGLSFFPPKKLATESAKLLYQIGLGIVSAAGITAVDAFNNNLSAATIAIDFGTAFIPIIGHKIKQLKNFRKLKKGVTRLVSEQDSFIKSVEIGKEAVEKKFTQKIAEQWQTLGKIDKPYAKWNKTFLKFANKPDDIFKHIKSLDLKDYKRFLKFSIDPSNIKHDAALLNIIAPDGVLQKAHKEFPGLFETILNKSVRDARWNKNLGIWTNFRRTAASKYGKVIDNSNVRQLLQQKQFLIRQNKLEKICNKIEDILKIKKTTLAKLNKRIRNYQKMIVDLNKIGKNISSGKQAFGQTIKSISKDKKLSELATKYIIYSKKQLKITEAAAKSNEVINQVLQKMKKKPEELSAFESLISFVKNVKSNPQLGIKAGAEQIETFLEPLLKSFSDDTLVFIHKLNNAKSVWRNSPTQFQEIIDFMGSELRTITETIAKPSKFKSIIRYLGSAHFDDKVVQRVQNIFDPRDAGRYGVERIYRKINQIVQKKINAFAEKKVVNNAIKQTTKNIGKLNASDNVADAVVQFEKRKLSVVTKTGGKVTNTYTKSGKVRMTHKVPSRYLSHYQILGKKGIYFIVWLHFNRLNTRGVGKNKNGKKPVWITATRDELYNIKTLGGTYFKEIAYRRGWEQSRGGRRYRSSNAFGNRDLSLFLGFMAINPLRRVLSLVSNIVEGSYSMATGNFFTRKWVDKFTTSFANTLKNRIGRLITRTGTKYLANKYRVVALSKIKQSMREYRFAIQKTQSKINFLARNVQKTGSLLLHNLRFEVDKSGTFQFKSQNYGKKTYKQFFRSYVTTSGRSLLIHKTAAKRRNSIIKGKLAGLNPRQLAILSEKQKNVSRELISGRRKLGQVLRIKSAVTPNAVFSKSFRGLTRFKL